MDPTIAELHQKIDVLTEQVAFLAEETRQQRRRRQEWEELQNDFIPVAGEVYRLSVEQLNEIEAYVQLEDGLRLFKRILRNTRNLERMLDQMESLAALWQDMNPLSQDAFFALMRRLDEMEGKGYFKFASGGLEMMDNVVTSFSEDDIRQLGDNIVLILQTVKEMTQPDILNMMQNTAAVIREEDPVVDISMFTILRQLNDPAVKRGLSKTLSVLRTVSEN